MMPRIVDYQIVTEQTLDQLVEEVCVRIEEGFEPFGSVHHEVYTNRHGEEADLYAQPLVKYLRREGASPDAVDSQRRETLHESRPHD